MSTLVLLLYGLFTIACSEKQEHGMPIISIPPEWHRCGSLPELRTGARYHSDFAPNTTTQSVLKVSCGYWTYPSTFEVVCNDENQWNIPIECQREKCSDDIAVPNGKVDKGLSYVGTRRVVRCDDGYRLVGWPYIFCHIDQVWYWQGNCTDKEPCDCSNGVMYSFDLVESARLGDDRIFKKELCTNNADPDSMDRNGWNSLMWAVTKQNHKMIEMLVDCQVNPNGKNRMGTNSLMIASKYGYIDTVKYLLANGAKVDDQDTFGSTPLILAAQQGHCQLVLRTLLAHGANSSLSDFDGNTPMIWAVRNNSPLCVELLISEGKANVNQANNNGVTPLMVAVRGGCREIMRILLNKEADPWLQDFTGKSAVDLAKEFNE